MKRIYRLSILLLMAMLTMPPLTLAAQSDQPGSPTIIDSGTCGSTTDGSDGSNLQWTLTSDGTLTISGSGPMADYYYDLDNGTTSIPWQKYNTQLKTLILCDGITSIGDYAFFNCGFTDSLTIPNSVKEIGRETFQACGFICCILQPTTPPKIDHNSFSGMIAWVPKGTTEIYRQECSDVVLMFVDTDADLTLHIATPGSLISEIRKVNNYVPADIPKLTLTGTLNDADWATLKGQMPLLYHLDLSGITNTTIPTSAFQDKESLVYLTLPKNLTEISSSAFSGCSGLIGSLTIPDGVTTIGRSAFSGCSGLTGSLSIPNSVTKIEEWAFENCHGFNGSLIIPEGVTTIGGYSFVGCSGFNGSLTIPEGVTIIGEHTFDGCSGFTGTLTIPESVIEISGFAFYNCNFTGTLTIPENVTRIGDYAFEGCSGFNGQLSIPNSITGISIGAFHGCSGLTGKIILPNSVTYVGSNCFARTGINAIVFGKNITEIPSDIVSGCTINAITCYSVIPPKVDANFTGVNTKTCKLKVPKGSFNEYVTAPVWCNFRNIEEVDVPADMCLVKATATNGSIISAEIGEALITTAVKKDSILSLQVIPDNGYRLASLKIDGTNYTDKVAEDGTFSTPAIVANMTIDAVFTEIISTVKIYTVGSSVVFNHEVPYGGTFSVLLETTGGQIKSITVQDDDSWLDKLVVGKLTIPNIKEDHFIVIDATDPTTTVNYAPEKQSDRLTVWTVDGRVFVAADAVMRSVEVFDLNGRSLLSVDVNATATDFGVPQRHTAYIVKAYLADGSTRTAKATVN